MTVTDEPKLEVKEISTFCNTIPQLKELSLTLTRDNIGRKGLESLMKDTRIHTSLTNIPINSIHLNISKNKITEKSDIMECESYFEMKCKEVKDRQILI